MENKKFQKIVEDYITAYNCFDIDKMLENMDNNVRFENISNGEVNLTKNGIEELRKQAEQTKKIFKTREQKITSFSIKDDQIEIDYKGILAMDIPNGLKAGDKFEIKGKSIFKFRNNKIIEFKDIS